MKWRPNAIKLASPWATLASAVSGLNPPAAMTGPRKILLNSCAATGACPSAMVAVLVRTLVGVVLEKLIDQVAIGGHQLDAVETRLLRVLGSRTILLEDAGDFRCLQRAMRRRLEKTGRRIDDDARISPIGRI